MQRSIVGLCLVVAGSGAGLAAHPALAANLCVGGPGCYATIPSALSAAQDGDTILIGKGAFTGGFTISRSVTIVGAGAGRTLIRRGSPVITIGEPNQSSEPTVSISGVTISGGANSVSPDPAIPQGGGLSVLPAAGSALGATVTVKDSVITDNSVAPSANDDCGSACSFSFPFGGGILNAEIRCSADRDRRGARRLRTSMQQRSALVLPAVASRASVWAP